MKLRIHRGTHEIGGSCIELNSGNSRVILDLGMPLVERDGSRFDPSRLSSCAGPELVRNGVLPDIPGLYAWDLDGCPVDALFLSHAHMDHCGLTHYIRSDVSVYSGAATRCLMDISTIFTPFAGSSGQAFTFQNGIPLNCGTFKITPFLVDHSVFDAYAFLIEAGKRILYSGDFREHGRKPGALSSLLKALSETRIDAILLEGTMFGRPWGKVASENELEEEIVQTIGNRNDICLACFSAQNIDRLVTFYRACLRCRRIFIVDVYTANVLETIHKFARIPYPSCNFPNLRVFFPYWLCKRVSDSGHVDLLYRFKRFKITRSEIEEHQRQVLMMVRSSMLSDLKKIHFSGGTFVYSMWEGYQRDYAMARLLEFSRKRQMDFYHIHSSGHATLETLKKMVDILQPGEVIPIHTFHPEAYIYLGAKIRMLNDGEWYNL